MCAPASLFIGSRPAQRTSRLALNCGGGPMVTNRLSHSPSKFVAGVLGLSLAATLLACPAERTPVTGPALDAAAPPCPPAGECPPDGAVIVPHGAQPLPESSFVFYRSARGARTGK